MKAPKWRRNRAKATLLGTIEAKAAIAKGEEEFKQPKERLMAAKRP